MRARIYVTFKQGVLEPQGKAVKGTLHSLGYEGVNEVRVGRLVELTLDAGSRAEAEGRVDEMCRRLLVNPVIEDYSFELEEDER